MIPAKQAYSEVAFRWWSGFQECHLQSFTVPDICKLFGNCDNAPLNSF